jgi:hypothetical protein
MSAPKTMTTLEVLAFAWASSGGWRSTVRSFDFRLALVVWILSSPFWLGSKWPDQIIAVLPNLLGFTLGGFAIFLGFGSDEFKGAIATPDERTSPYLSVSAAFMLFVSFQVAALLWAIVASALFAWPIPQVLQPWETWIQVSAKVGGGIGYFLFCYSVALILRAAVRIFRLSRWYNTYLNSGRKGGAAPVPRNDSEARPH